MTNTGMRTVPTIVHAMVGNRYVPGYQVFVSRYSLDADNAVGAGVAYERIPVDRGVSLEEACQISDRLALGTSK
jgi:hypothetical protein